MLEGRQDQREPRPSCSRGAGKIEFLRDIRFWKFGVFILPTVLNERDLMLVAIEVLSNYIGLAWLEEGIGNGPPSTRAVGVNRGTPSHELGACPQGSVRWTGRGLLAAPGTRQYFRSHSQRL
ncbi:hypothetical protein B0H13DRAFT_1864465 [Mycena leptocephala]|nr:hypothetical protein B0H13DRAFT_1864465 [Mycena leptocephala]